MTEVITYYGYTDGSGEYYIIIDAEKCNSCEECTKACPQSALKMEAMIIPDRSLPQPRAETCKSLIQQLWSEGWFATPHGLGEVHSEMARRGFHYDRTAVAHALVDLMKEGLLTREGKPRRYRYAQKRPPRT